MNRVYITSYSCISSLGHGINESLETLACEKQPINIPSKDDILFLPYFSIKHPLNFNQDKILCSELALNLLSETEKDWKSLKYPIPLFLATSTGGIKETENAYKDIEKKNIHYPLFKKHFFNKIYDDIQEKYNGKINRIATFSTACSSAGVSLLQAYNLIKNGIIDNAVVIGVDVLSLTTMVGFNSLKLISQTNTKPLTNERDGLSLGEGGGILVLDSKPIKEPACEILGCHSNSDGYHISSPDPEGREQKECITRSIQNSKLNIDDIDYINAHGTGTLMNDEVEIKVIGSVFPNSIAVSSLKAFIGHTLGASAVIETALCIAMLKSGYIYQVNNLGTPMNKKYVPEKTIKKQVKHFLKNSFGFGGSNVSIVFKV